MPINAEIFTMSQLPRVGAAEHEALASRLSVENGTIPEPTLHEADWADAQARAGGSRAELIGVALVAPPSQQP